ncbi:MAG: DUF3098 domain-containing protein [Bacteroidales bacterium]|nr:DUF3098 domain-containing protein [Bacteroidales bacterium]
MKQKENKNIKENKTIKETQNDSFVFSKENYILMLIGIAFLAVGYLLMTGGAVSDPNVFNPEVFSFRRITLAPVLIVAGFVIEVFAIMKRFNRKKEE